MRFLKNVIIRYDREKGGAGNGTYTTEKYDTITHYLKTNGGSQVTLTFTQFDELLFPHSGLPKLLRQMSIGGQTIISIQKRALMVG